MKKVAISAFLLISFVVTMIAETPGVPESPSLRTESALLRGDAARYSPLPVLNDILPIKAPTPAPHTLILLGLGMIVITFHLKKNRE